MKAPAASLARSGSGWAKQAGAIEDCSIHGSLVLGETADIFRIAYDPCCDIAGSGSIAYLIYFAVSSHMSCGPPGACDTPGMILLGPMIYLGIPAARVVTGILTLKIWIDLRSTRR